MASRGTNKGYASFGSEQLVRRSRIKMKGASKSPGRAGGKAVKNKSGRELRCGTE
jgi:hypothetical protein